MADSRQCTVTDDQIADAASPEVSEEAQFRLDGVTQPASHRSMYEVRPAVKPAESS